ncbi:hypothetical protein [Acetonema longum]|uniref:Uncharacterized protein n=1 Tax=Acetonema longum DSM 6540 TaxID=1009370 RepID=F7NG77_9FIRM|nr:hypothetical protein [Acetonema longum]EGO64995.1 hypothetical protein ALO_05318 [Acetonema longum DSM 6540]
MPSNRVVKAETLIHADVEDRLLTLENSLLVVSGNIGLVSGQMEAVSRGMISIQAQLAELAQDFHDFIQRDIMAKQLQLAETRLVKVRQELENNFGHYDEIRRRTTGIIQTVDVNIVRQETICSVTEELMLAVPRYWLAPGLIALAAWLNDNQLLAERAVREALRRDDEKTSLFFALVCRRGSRLQASRIWLERYLSLQNPQALDRQIVVLIDAFANGVFGPDIQGQCVKPIEAWIQDLSAAPGFREEQQNLWTAALEAKLADSDIGGYHYLRQYSPEWDKLQAALIGARWHQMIYDDFAALFMAAAEPEPDLIAAVDDLLAKLATCFDKEELPLRRDERLLLLIIEEQGDKKAAQSRYEAECKALDETIGFSQLLTNFALHPALSQASKATQRLAVALSRDWIIRAYDRIASQRRSEAPQEITISIEGWRGTIPVGANGQELIDSLDNYHREQMEQALQSTKLNLLDWFAVIAGIDFLILGAYFMNFFYFAIGLGGVIWFLSVRQKVRKYRRQTSEVLARLRDDSRQILQAALAEAAEWQRSYAAGEAAAAKVGQLLTAITPERYILSRQDIARPAITRAVPQG